MNSMTNTTITSTSGNPNSNAFEYFNQTNVTHTEWITKTMSDGGCSSPGDVCKVFATGTPFVMIGGLLAGHTECDGNLIDIDGKQFKVSYGMSSELAADLHYTTNNSYKTSEGSIKQVPYRGDVFIYWSAKPS